MTTVSTLHGQDLQIDRCDVFRIDAKEVQKMYGRMEIERAIDWFGRQGLPVIVQGLTDQWPANVHWRREEFIRRYGQMELGDSHRGRLIECSLHVPPSLYLLVPPSFYLLVPPMLTYCCPPPSSPPCMLTYCCRSLPLPHTRYWPY
jgi:hypothetical protein